MTKKAAPEAAPLPEQAAPAALPQLPRLRPGRLADAGNESLGTPSGIEQKVTWLELFFDLIFVVAFDQLSKRLGDSHTPGNIGAFVLLFVAVWWAWSTNATFAARYGNESRAYRWGTLAELVTMALIALTLRGDLHDTGIFFALGFGLNRLLHAGLHLWVTKQSRQALVFSRKLALASLLAAALWVLSAFFPGGGSVQLGLWVVALLLDILAPVLVREHGLVALPHEGHLPERVGLLQIIALGGVVTEIVGGGRRQALSWVTLLPAFLSMTAVVCLWRLYFDQARALPLLAAHIRGGQGKMLAWLYGHLPFTLCVVVLGVGIGHGISSADAHEVAVQQQFVVWSLAGALLALAGLRGVSLRVAGFTLRERSMLSLLLGAAAFMGMAFLDLDTKWLSLGISVVMLLVALVVANDPMTGRLGHIEEKVTSYLEEHAAEDRETSQAS